MLVHEWRALDARHVGCEHFLACLLAVGGPEHSTTPSATTPRDSTALV